jgi:hypothetical protein
VWPTAYASPRAPRTSIAAAALARAALAWTVRAAIPAQVEAAAAV